MANVTREKARSNPPKGSSTSVPGCTSKGVNYTLKCVECRRVGVRRVYVGGSSRSPYQRGREHLREVKEGVLDHLMVQHF